MISEGYRRQNMDLHKAKPNFGANGKKWAETILKMAGGCSTLLDYGCGKGSLKRRLKELSSGLEVREYDPAVPGKETSPEPADFVVCTDVLEHVEPEHIDAVMRDLARCTGQRGFFVISCRPAHKHFSDGSNAHRIIELPEWWKAKVAEYFRIEGFIVSDNRQECAATVAPLS